jgi:hypothetical protein
MVFDTEIKDYPHICPLTNKEQEDCEGCKFTKESLCDWPFAIEPSEPLVAG